MHELFRRLAERPWITAELILASLFANILALASPLFSIQVLNRYLVSGVDATLWTLTAGVCAAIALEVCFRQVRQTIAARALGVRDEDRAIGALGVLATAKRWALDAIPAGERREAMRGLDTVESTYNASNVGAILDVPFAILFLLALTLLNVWLGLVASVFVAFVFAYGMLSQRLLRGPMAEAQSLAAQGNALVGSSVTAADAVRAFGAKNLLMESWQGYVRSVQGVRRTIAARQARAQQVSQTAQAVMSVAMFALGAVLVLMGELDVGTMIGANILSARALGPVTRFAQLNESMAKAREALSKVEQLAALPTEPEQGTALSSYNGAIEVRDVGFTYPGAPAPIFEGVSFKLPPGSVMVVTGKNGTGKTTLARLLVGLLEPGNGQVLADGIDVRQLVPDWWRRQLLYLPQEPAFVGPTLRHDLTAAAGDGAADDESLLALVHDVGLGRFVDESPDGLDMPIQNNGTNLALGIRRRLAMARALCVGGKLAVFDEPTEGLDIDGKKAVYAVMKRLAEEGRTLILFSHDPVLLKGARLVLDMNFKPEPKFTGIPDAQRSALLRRKDDPKSPSEATEAATATDVPPPPAQAGETKKEVAE